MTWKEAEDVLKSKRKYNNSMNQCCALLFSDSDTAFWSGSGSVFGTVEKCWETSSTISELNGVDGL